MKIALIGTRGIPARYGGFETAVEEIGSRLAFEGHEVLVYCRSADGGQHYRGMRRVYLPSIRRSSLETLSNSMLSAFHHLRWRADVAVVFNAANAPIVPLVRAVGTRVAVHVDGLEWKRGKWGSIGRRYYLLCEWLSVKLADVLISDAIGIQEYYYDKYGSESFYLAYGAPLIEDPEWARLSELDLEYGKYHLVVARMEPENNVKTIVEGYARSSARYPLIVVGSAPYGGRYQKDVYAIVQHDRRVRFVGSVWDQELLDVLYAGATTYLHGHSVGGTNPSLLRAMGASAFVAAFDVKFNREVLGDAGVFFGCSADVSEVVEKYEDMEVLREETGRQARARASDKYRWDDVARGYSLMFERMVSD